MCYSGPYNFFSLLLLLFQIIWLDKIHITYKNYGCCVSNAVTSFSFLLSFSLSLVLSFSPFLCCCWWWWLVFLWMSCVFNFGKHIFESFVRITTKREKENIEPDDSEMSDGRRKVASKRQRITLWRHTHTHTHRWKTQRSNSMKLQKTASDPNFPESLYY